MRPDSQLIEPRWVDSLAAALDPFAMVEPFGARVATFDPRRLASWWGQTEHGLRPAMRAIAQHTGLPVVLVAAIAAAFAWNAFRRGLRFAFEVAVALVILAAATRLGLIRW